MLIAPRHGSPPRDDARGTGARGGANGGAPSLHRGGGRLLAGLLALAMGVALPASALAGASSTPDPTSGSTAGAAMPPEARAPAAEEETRLPARPVPQPLDPAPVETRPVGHMDLSHEDQLGLALLPGSGYRMIVPYKDKIFCGQLDKRVCTGRIPWFLDVEPSFGLSRGWDVLVTLRFGIEKDFATHRQFAAMPGFRYWVDRDTALRLYTTVQFVYDQTDQNHQADVSNTDFGVRNANGFMYDIVRNFSLYFQFAETMGFNRWFRFEMDGGVGLQARVP